MRTAEASPSAISNNQTATTQPSTTPAAPGGHRSRRRGGSRSSSTAMVTSTTRSDSPTSSQPVQGDRSMHGKANGTTISHSFGQRHNSAA
jgi:hypothetical protein